MTVAGTQDRELVISRPFNAPRELVFKVWTQAEHIINWWGPTGFTNTIHQMDVRPGGTWKFTMHGPDGTDYPNEITFIEITEPSWLRFEYGSGDPNDPGKFETTVTFVEKAKQTELTMRMIFKTKEARDEVVEKYGAIEGNRQTMDKLEKYLRTLI